MTLKQPIKEFTRWKYAKPVKPEDLYQGEKYDCC